MAKMYDEVPLSFGSSTNIRVIKILQVQPGLEHYRIACKIDVVPMDAEVPYTAVSYMWGDATSTQDILVNGTPFPVRDNLYHLLMELTSTHHEGYLWIDALCINQNDITERNHQVALMGQIYSNAVHVIVWLGLANEVLGPAMVQLQDFTNCHVRSSPAHRFSGQRIEATYEMEKLFENHPYWTRAWIVQELLLAKSFSIYCGSYKVPEKTLVRYFEYLDDELHQKSTAEAWTIWKSFPVRLMRQRKLWHSTDRVFINPWQSRIILGCSDVRDRVYSMIAFMDPAIAIVPDYSKSVPELFEELVYPKHPRCHSIYDVVNLLAILELTDDNVTFQRYLAEVRAGA